MSIHTPPPVLPTLAAADQDGGWRNYLDLARRWWWLALISALVAAAAAFGISRSQTPIYQTTAKLLINQAAVSGDYYSDILTSQYVAQTYAEWMNQSSLVGDTMAQLGLPRDGSFVGQQITSLAVAPQRDSQIIVMTVEGPNPELIVAFARLLPQLFARRLQEVQTSRYAETKASLTQRMTGLDKQIETTQNAINLLGNNRSSQQDIEYNRLSEELSRLRSSYNNLAETYESLLLTEAQSVDTIAVFEEPALPSAPVRPTTARNVLLGAILGMMVAGGLVLLYESFIDRFRSADEMRQMLGLPVLGTIGKFDHEEGYSRQALVAITEPRSLPVEAFRRLRTNLRFADVDAEMKSLAITSANPNEGKSVVSANLAVVMAQSGLAVILVDADLRKPKQHLLFELARNPGLTDALLVESFAQIETLLQPVGAVPNLRILSVGRAAPNPAELLGSKRMTQLIADLEQHADLVIFDTPPVLAVSDAQVVGTQVDGALLVMDAQRTTRKMARVAIEALDQVNVNLLGLTVNRVDGRSRGYYYAYHDYYDDGDGGSGGQPAATRRARASGWRRWLPTPNWASSRRNG